MERCLDGKKSDPGLQVNLTKSLPVFHDDYPSMNTRQILVAFSSYCDDECPIAINHIHIRKTTHIKPRDLIQEFLVPIKGITTLENLLRSTSFIGPRLRNSFRYQGTFS